MTFATDLEAVLSLDPAVNRSRTIAAFDRSMDESRQSIVIGGAGAIGRDSIKKLGRIGIVPVALADNNPALHGSSIGGVPVISPTEAVSRYGDFALFIVCMFSGSPLRSQLRSLGCKRVISYEHLWARHNAAFGALCALDDPENVPRCAGDIRRAFSLCADEASQTEFLAQLRYRAWTEFESMPTPLPNAAQYFPESQIPLAKNEVFVDCGAFDGDTLRAFLTRRGGDFERIVAIEADPRNYGALGEYVGGLSPDIAAKITTLETAVGATEMTVRFDAQGSHAGRVTESGTVEVPCARLDVLLRDHVPTYIKMDIEGAELDALAGADHILRNVRPVWAVASYHHVDHLWRVPLLIHERSPGSRFLLRRYAEGFWDTIWYAIPPARLKAGVF